MAITPGEYNFTLQRRSDWSLNLQFKDSDESPINLTAYTVAAQAWDKERTIKYADFAVAYTNREQGRIKLSLARSVTSTFPDEMYYDVQLQDGAGLREYYLEGVIIVDQGYTEP